MFRTHVYLVMLAHARLCQRIRLMVLRSNSSDLTIHDFMIETDACAAGQYKVSQFPMSARKSVLHASRRVCVRAKLPVVLSSTNTPINLCARMRKDSVDATRTASGVLHSLGAGQSH